VLDDVWYNIYEASMIKNNNPHYLIRQTPTFEVFYRLAPVEILLEGGFLFNSLEGK